MKPINEEAWHWYNDNVGKKNCPIVDTWWQTETGGIMISPLPHSTPTIPTYATLPLPGIQPALMDEEGNEMKGYQVQGKLCIKFPWPEWQERFGAIINATKTPISLPTKTNISLGMALCVIMWGITELPVVPMMW